MKNWGGIKIGSLAKTAASASLNPTRTKHMNLWDKAFYGMEPTFLTTRRFKAKSKNKTPKRSGYEIEAFKKYIYLRILKRSGKKYASNWVNLVQEMYNGSIAQRFATLKIDSNNEGWTKKIKKMQSNTISINSRYE